MDCLSQHQWDVVACIGLALFALSLLTLIVYAVYQGIMAYVELRRGAKVDPPVNWHRLNEAERQTVRDIIERNRQGQ